MKPFFKDHTSYGAVLAMLLPPAIAMVWRRHKTSLARVLWGSGGVVERGDRAVLHPCRLGEPGCSRRLVGRDETRGQAQDASRSERRGDGWVGLVLGRLVVQLERNNQDSSDNFTQHIESISNVSTDDSNLERLNRWSCALAMFEERPFGDGAQGRTSLNTRLSNVHPSHPHQHQQRRLGNAHSEYLGPLAEQGLLGLLAVLGLLAATLHLGFKLQRT